MWVPKITLWLGTRLSKQKASIYNFCDYSLYYENEFQSKRRLAQPKRSTQMNQQFHSLKCTCYNRLCSGAAPEQDPEVAVTHALHLLTALSTVIRNNGFFFFKTKYFTQWPIEKKNPKYTIF